MDTGALEVYASSPHRKCVFRHQFKDSHEAVVVRNPEFEKEQPVFKIFQTFRSSAAGTSSHLMQLTQKLGSTAAVATIYKFSDREKSIIQLL